LLSTRLLRTMDAPAISPMDVAKLKIIFLASASGGDCAGSSMARLSTLAKQGDELGACIAWKGLQERLQRADPDIAFSFAELLLVSGGSDQKIETYLADLHGCELAKDKIRNLHWSSIFDCVTATASRMSVPSPPPLAPPLSPPPPPPPPPPDSAQAADGSRDSALTARAEAAEQRAVHAEADVRRLRADFHSLTGKCPSESSTATTNTEDACMREATLALRAETAEQRAVSAEADVRRLRADLHSLTSPRGSGVARGAGAGADDFAAALAARAQAEERAAHAESEVLRLHCELQAFRSAMFGDTTVEESTATAPPPLPKPGACKKFVRCFMSSLLCCWGCFVGVCAAFLCAPCRRVRVCTRQSLNSKICPFQNAGASSEKTTRHSKASDGLETPDGSMP